MNKKLISDLLRKIYQYKLIDDVDLIELYLLGDVDESYCAWAEICQLIREVEEEEYERENK